MIEDEEVRMLRKEMVPRAQLMPFFDRPFYPQRYIEKVKSTKLNKIYHIKKHFQQSNYRKSAKET